MAGELQTSSGPATAVYALLQDGHGRYLKVAALTFESFSAGDYALYPITMTEIGSTGVWTGTMPAVPAGDYRATFYLRGGASPANGDPPASDVTQTIYWDGANPVSVGVVGSQLYARLVPSDPSLVTLYGYEGTAGDPLVGVAVTIAAANPLLFVGSRRFASLTVYTDVNGYWTANVPASASMTVKIPSAGIIKNITTPASGSVNYKDL